MGKEYECCGQIIEVLRGEAINNRNTGCCFMQPCADAIGICYMLSEKCYRTGLEKIM